MEKSRKKALLWHHRQKDLRIEKAKREAIKTLNNLNTKDLDILELALSMIYLGEGAKTQATSLGNANPLIINFFIGSLEKLYKIDRDFLKPELHLRNDQSEKEAIEYWSREIGIDQKQFTFVKDK